MKEMPATVRPELVLCFPVQKYNKYKYKRYRTVNLSVPLGDGDPWSLTLRQERVLTIQLMQ